MTQKNEDSVSIIVPFYNEEGNVMPLVERVHEALATFNLRWERVLIDDGSSDATLERLQAARQRFGAHVHSVSCNAISARPPPYRRYRPGRRQPAGNTGW
ncbi:MAG: glycosyltransferase [Thiolinea sp.]